MIKSRIARHVIYPFHEHLLKRPTFPYLAELERAQWLSRADVEKLQERKARSTIDFTLLSDSDMKAAISLGIAFRMAGPGLEVPDSQTGA